MNPLLNGLAELYGAAAGLKNELYDRGFTKPENCGRPVISVGNLTVGGTGKTPIVDFCARLLQERGHKPGIVCRSYGASAKTAGRVVPSKPEIYGDEACWYAAHLPGIPVWSGPVKTETAKALVAGDPQVDVILLDDGFQHRRLHRDVDLLLMDATDTLDKYKPVPAGRARENFGGLKRSTAVLLTKSNLAAASQLSFLKQNIAPGRPVFEFTSKLKQAAIPETGSLLLVSGIARPESFSGLVDEWLPYREKYTMSFVDHHQYTAKDVQNIQAVAARQKASAILITEKDSVKLSPLWSGSLPLIALGLEVSLKASVESFYAVLSRAFQHSR